MGTRSRCPGTRLSRRACSFQVRHANPRGAQAVKQRSGRSSAGATGVFTFGACGKRTCASGPPGLRVRAPAGNVSLVLLWLFAAVLLVHIRSAAEEVRSRRAGGTCRDELTPLATLARFGRSTRLRSSVLRRAPPTRRSNALTGSCRSSSTRTRYRTAFPFLCLWPHAVLRRQNPDPAAANYFAEFISPAYKVRPAVSRQTLHGSLALLPGAHGRGSQSKSREAWPPRWPTRYARLSAPCLIMRSLRGHARHERGSCFACFPLRKRACCAACPRRHRRCVHRHVTDSGLFVPRSFAASCVRYQAWESFCRLRLWCATSRASRSTPATTFCSGRFMRSSISQSRRTLSPPGSCYAAMQRCVAGNAPLTLERRVFPEQ